MWLPLRRAGQRWQVSTDPLPTPNTIHSVIPNPLPRCLTHLKNNLINILEVIMLTSLHHYLWHSKSFNPPPHLSAEGPIKTLAILCRYRRTAVAEAWSCTVKHAQVAAQGPRQKVHKGAETHRCCHQLFSKKVNISHILGIQVRFCGCLQDKYLRINILWVWKRAERPWGNSGEVQMKGK